MATLGTKNARSKRTRLRGWLSESLKPSEKSDPSDALTKSVIESTRGSQTQDTNQSRISSKPSRKTDARAKEYKYGLIRLSSEHSNEGHFTNSTDGFCPVDIVAIHGLNGDAYMTFSTDNGAFWLADFLPNEFPGARIYTFGYPSEVFLSLGTGDFESWARNLLESLTSVRSSPADKRRPLIFICHSMGGIVVKKALNISVVEAEKYQDIRKSVEAGAILFMATPHRGSAIAELGAISASIGNVALSGTSRYTGQMRSDLLKSLKKGSKELQVIGRDFRNQTGSIKFYSFIEDKTTFPSKERVVDDESGSIGVSNETIIPMLGSNHRNICQFEDRGDNGYKILLGHLRSTIDAATAHVVGEITSEDQSCLQSLAFSSMTDRFNEVSYKHPNTCDWIFKHAKFSAWMNSECSLLWVKGHPGTGKSTLMASVSSQLRLSQVASQYICLRFFFHGNGTSLQKSQLGLFRSLLHQVYRQSLSAKNMISAAFQEKSRSLTSDSTWALGELKELFFKIVIRCSAHKEILVFVDALDEAVDGRESRSAEVLLDYFHNLNYQIKAVGGKAKICISCRHYPQIKVGDAFQLSVENENENDLRTFVLDKLEDHVVGWHDESPTSQAALVQAIVEKAAGQFLWASIRLPEVTRSLNDGTRTFEDIQELLDSESSELFAVYENVLISNIDASMRPRSLLLLQWICFAQRPLSPSELRCALACDYTIFKTHQNGCDELPGYVKSDAQMGKLTKSLTGGLALVKTGDSGSSVQFIHQSVTDFVKTQGLHLFYSILKAETSWSSISVIGVSEDRLATTCLNYLSLRATLHGIKCWSEEDEQSEKDEEIDTHEQNENHERKLPLLRYATNHWTAHAERAEENGYEQIGKVAIFDANPKLFLSWVKSYWLFNPNRWHDMIDPWSRVSPGGASSLIHTASEFGLTSIVQHLLQRGTSVMERNENQWTPLHYAAYGRHSSMVEFLIRNGADVKAITFNGRTPMYMVARNGNLDIVQQLLHGGSSIDDSVGEFGTVLHTAAFQGNVGLVERLIDIGASPTVQGGKFSHVLQAAAVKGHVAVMKLLIARGADVNALGGPLGNALQGVMVCADDALACARILVEHGADVNLKGGKYGSALQAAALRQEWNIVEYLLQQGADVNAEGGLHGTALQNAASVGNSRTVRRLLDKGAEVNASGGTWGSALQAAAAVTDEDRADEVVQILLSAGANMFAQGDGRWGNALIAAAWAGNLELVKLFTKAGMDIGYPGRQHGNALQAATKMMRGPFRSILLEYKWRRNGQEILKVLHAHGATLTVDNQVVAGHLVHRVNGKSLGK